MRRSNIGRVWKHLVILRKTRLDNSRIPKQALTQFPENVKDQESHRLTHCQRTCEMSRWCGMTLERLQMTGHRGRAVSLSVFTHVTGLRCRIDLLVGWLVWRSDSTLVSINEVNLHRARLVLGWVTVSGFKSRCRTFISVCNQPPRSTQPGHPFVGRRNEYQPKGGDALRLGSKGRYGLCVGGR